MLAEREDDQAAAGLRVGRVGIEREPAAARVLAQEEARARRRPRRRQSGSAPRSPRPRPRLRRCRRARSGAPPRAWRGGAPASAPLRRRRGARRAPRRPRRASSRGGRASRRASRAGSSVDQRPEIGRMIGEAEEQVADPVALKRRDEGARLRRPPPERRACGALRRAPRGAGRPASLSASDGLMHGPVDGRPAAMAAQARRARSRARAILAGCPRARPCRHACARRRRRAKGRGPSPGASASLRAAQSGPARAPGPQPRCRGRGRRPSAPPNHRPGERR